MSTQGLANVVILQELQIEFKAYLAGFFDGEGCVNTFFGSTVHTTKEGKKRHFSPRVQLVFSNTSFETLDKFQGLLQVGNTSDNGKNHGHDLRITDKDEVISVIDVLLENSKIKRNQLIDLKKVAVALKKRGRKKWVGVELEQFYVEYMRCLEKKSSKGTKTGKHRTFPLKYVFTSPHSIVFDKDGKEVFPF